MITNRPPKKVFITGGAGFIGTNLAEYYLNQGSQVTIYDNLSRPGVDRNLEWLKQKFDTGNLNIQIKDILDSKSLNQSIAGHDYVIHQAGQTAVTTSLADPINDFEVNAKGTFNVLEAVRHHAPEALVIFASTNKVYGDLADIALSESETRYTPSDSSGIDEDRSLDFHSPYGCSKGAADQYTLDYARSFGLNTVVFRQSCIYGEHQLGVEDQGWVAHFALQALKDQPITLFGSGKQVRDILYIKDLVKAYDLAWAHQSNISAQAYNIGGGPKNSVSLIEVISNLENDLGEKIKIKYDQERVGDQKYYVSDTSKAEKDLGWIPTTKPQEGISHLLTWLKSLNKT
jgi:CDP-paratose 2-epimerase